jgi:uncharacterized Zn finger protein
MPNSKLTCEECGHEEQVECLDASLVGMMCPECGTSLFTKNHLRNYKRVQFWMALSRLLSKVIFWEKPRTYEVKIGQDRSEIIER